LIIIVSVLFFFSKLAYPKRAFFNVIKNVEKRDNIVTFFFQGHATSRSQASKYSGGEPIFYYVDEKIKSAVCKRSPLILHNIHPYPELEDIKTIPESFNDYILMFSHYLQFYYLDISGSFEIPITTKWNFSGELDVHQHLYYLRGLIGITPPDKKIVVFGYSRGASTALISICSLTEEEQNRISLLLLEAPFDDLKSVLNNWSSYKTIVDTFLGLLTEYTNYSMDQETPMDVVKFFPKNIPIGFITSNKDTLVPKSSTLKIIESMKNNGHEMIHHCQLKNSSHCTMTIQDEEDQRKYIDFVEYLYDEYVP
jgi:hypothetical protein